MLGYTEKRALYRRWSCPPSQPSYAGAEQDGSIHALAATFLQRVPENSDILARFWMEKPQRYSTVCSGTDSPVLVINALADAARKAFNLPRGTIQTVHTFACEKKAEIRTFLLRMHPNLKLVYKDLGELHAHAATHESGGKQVIPQSDGTIGGFPCTDVSRLNKNHGMKANRSCVNDATMRTGAVFHMILRYLRPADRSSSG